MGADHKGAWGNSGDDGTVLCLGCRAGYMILCFSQNIQNHTLKVTNFTVYTLYFNKRKCKIALIIKSKKKKKTKCVSSGITIRNKSQVTLKHSDVSRHSCFCIHPHYKKEIQTFQSFSIHHNFRVALIMQLLDYWVFSVGKV